MAPTTASRDCATPLVSTNYHTTSNGGKEYIRKIPRAERALLITGILINIVDHQGKHIIAFPLALFNAASTKKERVVEGTILLPDKLDIAQTKRFLSMMMMVPQHGCVCRFDKTDNTFIDLHFHSAAEYLGMDTFTQAIFDIYFKRVNSQIPAVANIEAIALVHTPPADKIFKQMSYKIGVDYFEDKIVNRVTFEAYLQKNERLRLAVEEFVARKQRAAQREINHDINKAAFLERQRKRDGLARATAGREERSQQWHEANYGSLDARKAVADAKVKERQEHEIAVRKSMLQKKRTKQAMTLEEVRAHETLFGKAVPF
jgi:hypothetical protein